MQKVSVQGKVVNMINLKKGDALNGQFRLILQPRYKENMKTLIWILFVYVFSSSSSLAIEISTFLTKTITIPNDCYFKVEKDKPCLFW